MSGLSAVDHRYASRAEGDLWLTVHSDPRVAVETVLVYFHGGGWTGGTRALEPGDTRLLPLTAMGTAVVSADYRLTPDAVWPAQLDDAGKALEWTVRAFPSASVFVSGSSAGGHLAGLIGLGAWERLTGRPHTRPAAGVITYAAVADPLAWDAERLTAPLPLPGTFAHWSYERNGQWPPGGLGRRLLNGADTRVSPRLSNHVGTTLPPFLIVHGDRDTCVSYRESVRLFEVLSAGGGDAFLLEAAGADHEDPGFGSPVVRGSVAGFIAQFRAGGLPFPQGGRDV